jgi:hypothetical protein
VERELIDGGLRAIFREHIREAFFISIESPLTVSGIPDAHFIFHDGTCGFLEFKLSTTDFVRFAPMQIAFADRYTRLGGRHYIAIRKRRTAGRRVEACDELHLYFGTAARQLLLQGLRAPGCLGRWQGGVRGWKWDQVSSCLQGRYFISH